MVSMYCQNTLKFDIANMSWYILDWSGNQPGGTKESPQIDVENLDKGFATRLWMTNPGQWQTNVWKLATAMGQIERVGSEKSLQSGTVIDCSLFGTVIACVNLPYALIVEQVKIEVNHTDNTYNVNYTNCSLTNCISFSLMEIEY